jgi:hypothetical protein
METARIAISLGQSIFETVADRLSVTNIIFNNAKFIPKSFPFTRNIDCTDLFRRVLIANGGLEITNTTFNEIISDENLIDMIDAINSKDSSKNWLSLLMTPHQWIGRRSTRATDGNNSKIEGWLCVEFSLPGAKSYIKSYYVPHEKINFPPRELFSEFNGIIPLQNTIVDASFSGETDTFCDITDIITRLGGLSGNFFGRDKETIQKLVINYCILEKKFSIDDFITILLTTSLSINIIYGDGREDILKK